MRSLRPPRQPARREQRDDHTRGQTTIDFAIGATVFLLTIAFVFTFIPVMFQPFATSQSTPLVADRVANTLATDILGNPSEPYVLNETCTVAFFAGDDPYDIGCRHPGPEESWDASDHPRQALNLEDGTEFNISLVAPDGTIEEQIGAPTDGSRDVIIAHRRVLYKQQSYELFVRVW